MRVSSAWALHFYAWLAVFVPILGMSTTLPSAILKSPSINPKFHPEAAPEVNFTNQWFYLVYKSKSNAYLSLLQTILFPVGFAAAQQAGRTPLAVSAVIP